MCALGDPFRCLRAQRAVFHRAISAFLLVRVCVVGRELVFSLECRGNGVGSVSITGRTMYFILTGHSQCKQNQQLLAKDYLHCVTPCHALQAICQRGSAGRG